MKVVKWDELETIAWKNGAGSAVDLHVLPAGAGWDDFEWRANIAWFDRDVPFSSYPGIHRYLIVLKGRFTIVVDGKATPLTPDSATFEFSGEATTEARDVDGPVRAFNVLVRPEFFAPSVLASAGHAFLGRDPQYGGPELIHVVAGTAVARRLTGDLTATATLQAGDTLIGDGTPVDAQVAPDSRIVIAAIEPDLRGWRSAQGVRVIAHRGASGHAPENTRAAFELAIAMGADAIETDVRQSGDGVPVLFHDATVDRTSDGTGAVSSFSLAQLSQLDVGSWFGEGCGPQRMMTLDHLLVDFGRRIPLVIEIKEGAAVGPTMERLRGARARWEVTSFDWDSVVAARALVPGGRYGFLSRHFDETVIARCVDAGLDQICPPASLLTAHLVWTAKEAALDVRAHGVKSRADVARLFETKVDGATINWPEWIRKVARDS